MIHDDLEPCKQKANISLSFTNNMESRDKYAEQVHCAHVQLYDREGKLYGTYPYESDAKLSLMLPLGQYHVIAYGGASCDVTDVDFNHPVDQTHHYSTIETTIKGTRAAELAKDLHAYFHAMGDFTVQALDYGEVNHNLDLIKNTNRFDVELRYTDGSKIAANKFKVYLTADNAVTDHANNVVPQGQDVIYRPFSTTECQADKAVDGVKPWLGVYSLSTGRLTAGADMKVHIDRADNSKAVEIIDLDKYLTQLHKKELGSYTYQQYLDRQDTYLVEVEIEPDGDRLIIVSLKINKWNMVLNDYEL